MSKILVTGGTGFVAGHVILQLLAAGHEVRTTLRNPARETEIRAALAGAGMDAGARLSCAVANLQADDGWAAAMDGCDFVHHVASPFPATAPDREEDLIVPARDGTLRVLRAAAAAGVRRVVMTSSFAAVGYGHSPRQAPFDETDWTNLQADGLSAYTKSKTLAERAAWDFAARCPTGPELCVVNPVGIFGPALGPALSSSVRIIRVMLTGAMPRCPRLYFGAVDVRDVADLHLRAMTHPAAAGERFLAVSGNCISLLYMARMLRHRLGAAAARVPDAEAPDWLLRLVALWNRDARRVLPDLGKIRNSTSAKAQRMLGWQPRPAEEAVIAAAQSLQHLGLLS